MSFFQNRLGKDETLLWEGRPSSQLRRQKIDTFLVPFSIVWAGFAICMTLFLWATGAPLFFRLLVLPMLVVAAYLTFGRFQVDRYIRDRTRYGVTNQRILITQNLGKNLQSLDLAKLPAIVLDEYADGNGTIQFGIEPDAERALKSELRLTNNLPRFVDIPQARQVHAIISTATKTTGPF